MSKTNVFIAPKIKVGFQKRDDTYNGQLAYIIYFDEKGKLRKEKSWDGWRDHKIAPQEFDNKPMDGFTLNKDVKRYSGEWFSSHRTMIRVHDPRGFEFEVTTENLIGILMHTDCLRRGLIGQFVYAWVGPELVLLPTNSEEYQNAAKYTSGLAKKVSAKELVPGVSYKTKREGDVVYLGKFNWYEYVSTRKYGNRYGLREEAKVMVFTANEGKTFMKKSSADFLAEANSTAPVSNFAELVAKFNKFTVANKVVQYEFRPATFNPEAKLQYGNHYLKDGTYFVPSHNRHGAFAERTIQQRTESKRDVSGNWTNEQVLKGYTFYDEGCYYGEYAAMVPETGELVQIIVPRDHNSSYYRNSDKIHSLEEMQKQQLFHLYIKFENGRERRVKSFSDLHHEKE